jgi:hypothetical protein
MLCQTAPETNGRTYNEKKYVRFEARSQGLAAAMEAVLAMIQGM